MRLVAVNLLLCNLLSLLTFRSKLSKLTAAVLSSSLFMLVRIHFHGNRGRLHARWWEFQNLVSQSFVQTLIHSSNKIFPRIVPPSHRFLSPTKKTTATKSSITNSAKWWPSKSIRRTIFPSNVGTTTMPLCCYGDAIRPRSKRWWVRTMECPREIGSMPWGPRMRVIWIRRRLNEGWQRERMGGSIELYILKLVLGFSVGLGLCKSLFHAQEW